MILKNTPGNRKLINRVSRYISDITPYFRPYVDKRWNCGADIRFEIASVGEDNMLIIGTDYTPESGFQFSVRLLQHRFEDASDLIRLTYRLQDAKNLLLNLQTMIEREHPEISEIRQRTFPGREIA